MKSLFKYIPFLTLLFVTFFSSCVREDDEPSLSRNPISRLYISFSEYQLDNAQGRFRNLDIIDPSDTSTSFVSALSYDSGIKGGATVVFNPSAKLIFQSSENGTGSVRDTTIQVMGINELTGSPAYKGFISNGLLTNVKGLAYHPNNGTQNLYVANIGSPSHVFLYQRPENYRGRAFPNQSFELPSDYRPWSITFKDTDLLMSLTGDKKGIAVFRGLLSKNPLTDSAINEASFPDKSLLTIEGYEIRGFSYSRTQDLLAVAAFTGAGETSVGSILLFENATSLLEGASATLTATRVISGAATDLKQPADVAIDDRVGARFLYVADRVTKKVSRFLITDAGNVAPDKFNTYTLTPVSLSLDARGPSE